MAHILDTNLRFSGATNPLVSNYTCGSGATLLVIGIVVGSSTQRSGGVPTYNGVEFTQADQTRQYITAPETSCELWYLADPETGSALEISIPNPISLPIHVQASSYITAAGKTSELDADNGSSGTSASPSLSVTSTEDGDVFVAVFGDGENFTPTGQSGTELNTTDNGLYSDSNQFTLQVSAGALATSWETQTYGAGVYGGGVYNGDDDWCMCVAAFKEVVISVTALPATLEMAVSVIIPSISSGSSTDILPPTVTMAVAVVDPVIRGDVTHEPTTLSITSALIAPSNTVDNTVTPPTLSLAALVQNISIGIQQNVTIVTSTLTMLTEAVQPNTLAPLPVIRMMPFIFSSDIAYPIEMGEEYARFYFDGEPLLGAGEVHVEVPTNYQSEDLYQLQTIQSADIMWVVHPSHPQAKLKRVTATSFTLEDIEFKDGPFIERNDIAEDDDVTMNVDVTEKGETGTLTRSGGTFQAGHVGALFKLTHPRVNVKTSGKKTGTQTGEIGERIDVFGDYIWSITSPTWAGTIRLQRSTDSWVSSTDVKIFTNAGTQTFSATEKTRDVQYRINVTAHSSGTISSSLVVNTSSVSGSATATGVIGVPLDIKGPFNFNTHGNWDATVAIERNENDAGWEPYREYISVINDGVGDRNVQFAEIEEENNVQFRINVTAYTSGTLEADIAATSSTKSGVVRINGILSNSAAEVTIVSKVSQTTDTKRWAEGAWSGVRGYPSAVTFFEERVVYGFTNTDQQNIWLSKTGKFENFEAGINNADSFGLRLPTANSGRWLGSLGTLAAGDGGVEWRIKAPLDEALTPTNFDIKKQTAFGSANLQVAEVGSVLLFVDSVGRKVREFTFSEADQKYTAPDLTALAENITVSGIVSMAHQKNPDSMLWCVLENGKMITLSYDREQNVTAWARHPMDGLVQSVAVIPASGEDEVWISIVRSVDAKNRVYIEKFESRVLDIRKENSFFVDSGIIYNGAAINVITGLGHLEGRTVAVLADGEVLAERRVEGGQIVLSTAARNVRVGLSYTSVVTPMRLDVNLSSGTTLGSIKKIPEISFSFHNTLNAKYGVSTDALFNIDWDDVKWKNTSEVEGLFTGLVTAAFDGGFDVEDELVITQSDPLPCTVRAIIPRMEKTGR